jgi:predicted AlkP superfamily pyrophosphatase or phosphodiesterase
MRFINSRMFRSLVLCLLAALAWLTCAASASTDSAVPDGKPRLAVLLVFDQMRGDYLTRWEKLYTEKGFRRLMREGAWFDNCHYPYAHTVTGPGHASMLTGCSPEKHGIVGNEWFDRASGKEIGCVASDRYECVPPLAKSGGKTASSKWLGASPDRLLLPTVGDVLKEKSGSKGRVVSLSFKDRSAILPAGHHPDSCYWLDTVSGTFVTSTYYRDRLEPWVADFNQRKPADKWFDKDWTRLRPDLDYRDYSGPDDVDAEGIGIFQGRAFPHRLTGGVKKVSPLYFQALYNSPFGNELMLDLAKRAIDTLQLGQRDDPDLVCLSFSCNDPIGHCWGPDSQEVLDVTLRSDRIVEELLAYLDAKVGKGQYVIAMSADHGIGPLPEVSRQQGKPAGRISPTVLSRDAEKFLQQSFGKLGDEKTHWIEDASYPWIYLNREAIHEHGFEEDEVEQALARWIKEQPGFLTAYGRNQLLRGLPEDDKIGAQVRRSFYADRSGDLEAVVKPYYLCTSRLTGTLHGTPHPYDTHVPLVVYGAGIQPGRHKEKVTPQAVAAILSRALDIPAPEGAEAAVPEGLFKTR